MFKGQKKKKLPHFFHVQTCGKAAAKTTVLQGKNGCDCDIVLWRDRCLLRAKHVHLISNQEYPGSDTRSLSKYSLQRDGPDRLSRSSFFVNISRTVSAVRQICCLIIQYMS